MSAVLQRKQDGTGLGVVEVLAVEGSCGKEGASWQTLVNVGKRPVCARNVGVLLSFAREKAKHFLRDAEREKQEGTQGQWQQESPGNEFLEQVKSGAETDCTTKMMETGRNTKASSRLKYVRRNGRNRSRPSKWSCLLLRIVLQDPLSKVTKHLHRL